MYSFDGATRLITLDSGVTSVSVKDIYSRWKDWVIAGNANYPKAFIPVGGDDLGGGLVVPSYFFLTNGWRIKTHGDGTQITVSLNLYEKEGQSPFIIQEGDSVANQLSNIPGIENLGGLSVTDIQLIADAVWNKQICP